MIRRNLLHAILILAVVAFVGAGCGKDDKGGGGTDEADKTGQTDDGDKAGGKSGVKAKLEAKKIFEQRCSQCHGMSGKGDGPGAASLNPKPRDYTDSEWQKSITDEQIKEAIVKGGAAVGKSPTMAPNPDLGKPENKEVLDALVQMVRDFGQG